MFRVLIVDDEVAQRTLIRETLVGNRDLTFIEAENGTEALRQARATPHPDLIILDIMMPKMDGFQVCRILKTDATTRDIPVILVTALGHVEDRLAGRDLGAFDFINKPFEVADLQGVVRRALYPDGT
jgi:putative two-component system response regulator